jgi:two-component sensor histidine kinase/CHASE3 domain sensor protein
MPIAGRFVAQSSVILLAIGFLALLSIVGMTVWLNERSQRSFETLIAERDIRATAIDVRTALEASESSLRGYVATSNEIYLAPYDTAKTRMLAERETLKSMLAARPEMARLMARLDTVIAEKIELTDRIIGLKAARHDEEALDLLRTNRGKALLDEANVYLSGITIAAEERLTQAAVSQRSDTVLLRLVSIVGALVILLVVAGTAFVGLLYTKEIARSRDEVRNLNASLEDRVKRRTADLERARERAELLVAEVNHRVANSLALLSAMVKLQDSAVSNEAARQALSETQARILAIGLVHQRLYTSGDVRQVALDEYLAGLLEQLGQSMQTGGKAITLRYDLEPLTMSTDKTVNLGVVTTELVTNAWKYAYRNVAGEIRVKLHRVDGKAELVVEDDGLGINSEAPAEGTGLGSRIVTAMARSMKADVRYAQRKPGTAVSLTFDLPDSQKSAA